jgi:hypothetical protein
MTDPNTNNPRVREFAQTFQDLLQEYGEEMYDAGSFDATPALANKQRSALVAYVKQFFDTQTAEIERLTADLTALRSMSLQRQRVYTLTDEALAELEETK